MLKSQEKAKKTSEQFTQTTKRVDVTSQNRQKKKKKKTHPTNQTKLKQTNKGTNKETNKQIKKTQPQPEQNRTEKLIASPDEV